MSDDSPTLADDEAKLAAYATQLAAAFDAVALEWMVSLVARHQPDAAVQARTDLAEAAADTAQELRELLALDIADQPTGPLEVLRSAVRHPTALLQARGAVATERDPFAERNFPADVYDLTPASFAEVDPSLHEPGLIWGAAKAHVHLRRRRERSPDVVVVLSVDLMDRSKISARFPDATLVRSATKLVERLSDTAGSTLVLIDLARLEDVSVIAELAGPGRRVVAFGSHVDDTVLQAAAAAGAEAMPRSVFFRRLETGSL